VATVMRSTGVFGGSGLAIEQRLNIAEIHPESYGTPDCLLMTNSDIYIWDYKFGHAVVEAYMNWQMINYLAGIPINGYSSQLTTVHIRVIQPRAHHAEGIIREWTVKLSDLRGYWNMLIEAAHSNLDDSGACVTGSHCKYCHARYQCPAAIATGLSLYEMVKMPTPVELTPQSLGSQLAVINRALESIKLLQTGFEEQVKSLIRGGTLVPGFRTQMGKGREKWDKSTDEIIMLGDLMGLDFRKPDNIITPSAARKLGIDNSLVIEYASTPSTGLKIVPDKDNKAKRMFT